MGNHNTTATGAGAIAAQCPHSYVTRKRGGNWEWIYFASSAAAMEVIEWIKGDRNTKYRTRGRATFQGSLMTKAGKLWCVHAHLDNVRRVPQQDGSPSFYSLTKKH